MKLSTEQQGFLKIIINKGLIFISITWIVLLLGWLFIEEPFGSRVSNSEIREFLTLLSVPLMGLWLLGRLLYKYLTAFGFKKHFSIKTYNIVIALLFSFIVIGHYQIIQLKNKISYMSSSISDSEYRISDLYGRVSDVEEDLKSRLHKHY
jgi:hypothetical protein